MKITISEALDSEHAEQASYAVRHELYKRLRDKKASNGVPLYMLVSDTMDPAEAEYVNLEDEAEVGAYVDELLAKFNNEIVPEFDKAEAALKGAGFRVQRVTPLRVDVWGRVEGSRTACIPLEWDKVPWERVVKPYLFGQRGTRLQRGQVWKRAASMDTLIEWCLQHLQKPPKGSPWAKPYQG